MRRDTTYFKREVPQKKLPRSPCTRGSDCLGFRMKLKDISQSLESGQFSRDTHMYFVTLKELRPVPKASVQTPAWLSD